MKNHILSSFAKMTISVISIVAISACVVTFFVKLAESRLNSVKNYTYDARPINNTYLTVLEGGYWQLTSVEDTLQNKSTSVHIAKLSSVLDLLYDMNASYAYSYKDRKLASFWPMSDAKRVLEGWDLEWYENYLVLQAVVPQLLEENKNLPSGKYSESYAKFCEMFDSPLPSMAMTSYVDFAYNDDVFANDSESDRLPYIASGLTIQSLSKDKMVLSRGKHKLHYTRVKCLPLKIAPISVYFQETTYASR